MDPYLCWSIVPVRPRRLYSPNCFRRTSRVHCPSVNAAAAPYWTISHHCRTTGTRRFRVSTWCTKYSMTSQPHCPSNPQPSPRQPEWLCVLEADNPKADRRHPAFGHVYVKRTLTAPGPSLEARVKTDAKWIRQRICKVRYDLMPSEHEPGGLLRPFLVPQQGCVARKAEKDLKDRLSGLGYTVNGNTKVWHVYVIELELPPKPRPEHSRGYVYVGQTSIEVEERARQHRLGPAYCASYTGYSRICHKYFKQLRLDLLPDWAQATFFSRCDALRAEGRLRLHLEKKGFRVEGGTELLGDMPHECGSLRE